MHWEPTCNSFLSDAISCHVARPTVINKHIIADFYSISLNGSTIPWPSSSILFSALSLSTPISPVLTSFTLLLKSLRLNGMKLVFVCILVVYLLVAVRFDRVIQRNSCFLGLSRRLCECKNGTSLLASFQRLVFCSRSGQLRRILDALKTRELGLVLARRSTKTSIILNSATSSVVLAVSPAALVFKRTHCGV